MQSRRPLLLLSDGNAPAPAPAPQVGALTGLSKLLLAGFACLDDGAMASLSRGLVGLQDLTLFDCQSLGDAGLVALAALPQLRHVRLRGCRRVGTPGVQALLEAAAAARAAAEGDGKGEAGAAGAAALQVVEVSMCPRVRLSQLRNPAAVDIRCLRP